ncbi:class I SAM-dependent rRNA methyltransferase [Petrimonas sp.]|jgi:23S rRNA (cytosine1962-C5)-methyltransferase|uniref:class I SAM-dependent rRNA methyltransferase n=1 Tax=Petrimonas TaxID=307628 RepID=UPI000E94111A|nr:class I SAM-dependent rRNA methyltransferase [Petrimonas sp.]BBD44622.1 sam-dependent methyltransferase [Petrimonas sp. IBARAKI]HBF94970.1 RlmI/RlmK family 23S rRNA methyltransferase [Porphyromonadaceae bacterium]MDD4015823.1 class I SAM-dependent rRNA methyltransferase [Petrimonas sp.]MDD4536938.1 class I SAM-dependent rRNA methyltransferase [Petrimonas sp.]
MGANKTNQIILRPRKEESLKRFHPWVFSGAIAKTGQGIQEGDIVRVFSASGEFLGVGHYQVGSISVRILSFTDETINEDFYARRISSAYRMRMKIGLLHAGNNTFRLIHGEGDHLPGLIIDMYGKTAVVQAHSVGMDGDKEKIVDALQRVLGKDNLENIFYKSEGTLPFKAGIEADNDYLLGGQNVDPVALENGLRFNIDWLRGQKTGFFIDQRENRRLLEKYAAGKDVLNMFCYTGGFSVYALRGGARSVHSVDSSAKAVSLTDENIRLNFGEEPRHTSFSEDAFKFLKASTANAYDLIVLDPPAFAKHRGAISNALQGYKRLNLAALEKIKQEGILFTFSCSQAINKEQFRLAVFSAAAISGRKVSILHQLTQPADHPINIYHPEGEYLKGLVLFVE